MPTELRILHHCFFALSNGFINKSAMPCYLRNEQCRIGITQVGKAMHLLLLKQLGARMNRNRVRCMLGLCHTYEELFQV